MISTTSMRLPAATRMPVSSSTSRSIAATMVSPPWSRPPGRVHFLIIGAVARCTRRTRGPAASTTPPTATTGTWSAALAVMPLRCAKGLEQIDVGKCDGHARANDGDVAVLAEAREADAVAERDRRSVRRGAFFARTREHLAGGHHPSGCGWTVVVERAAQVGDAFTADLAAVAADDERGFDLAVARFLHRAEMRLTAGHSRPAHRPDLHHAATIEREEHDLDERVTRKLLQLAKQRAA